MEALLKGKLILAEGYLRIQWGRDKENAYSAIWRHEFDYHKEGDNIAILNGGGQVVAWVGEQMQVSGGEFPLTSPVELEQHVIGASKCSEPYWEIGYEVTTLVE